MERKCTKKQVDEERMTDEPRTSKLVTEDLIRFDLGRSSKPTLPILKQQAKLPELT